MQTFESWNTVSSFLQDAANSITTLLPVLKKGKNCAGCSGFSGEHLNQTNKRAIKATVKCENGVSSVETLWRGGRGEQIREKNIVCYGVKIVWVCYNGEW